VLQYVNFNPLVDLVLLHCHESPAQIAYIFCVIVLVIYAAQIQDLLMKKREKITNYMYVYQ
jgi:uncharacterized membrane protein YwaF